MNSLIEKVCGIVSNILSNAEVILWGRRCSRQTKTFGMSSNASWDEYISDFVLDESFMGLNDLMTEIRTDPASFLGEEATENKVLKQVLQLVEDKISEVKNQAVKWYVDTLVRPEHHVLKDYVSLGQLIKIIREAQMDFVVDKLIDFSASKDDELRDISGLGGS